MAGLGSVVVLVDDAAGEAFAADLSAVGGRGRRDLGLFLPALIAVAVATFAESTVNMQPCACGRGTAGPPEHEYSAGLHHRDGEHRREPASQEPVDPVCGTHLDPANAA